MLSSCFQLQRELAGKNIPPLFQKREKRFPAPDDIADISGLAGGRRQPQQRSGLSVSRFYAALRVKKQDAASAKLK